jgi:hypothetical protein
MRRFGVLGHILIIAVVGVGAGFMAGLLGVGGGVLMVPAFYYFLRDQLPDIHYAIGTSMAVIVPVSIFATIQHARGGYVNWPVVATIALFSIAGSTLGARVSTKMDPLWLKRIFAVLLVIVAIQMWLPGRRKNAAELIPVERQNDGPAPLRTGVRSQEPGVRSQESE